MKIAEMDCASLLRLAALLLVCGYLGAMALSHQPHLHDYAEWVYQGRVLLYKVIDPQQVSGFTLAHYPVPNTLVPALLALLQAALPPVFAAKIFLAILALGWWWTASAFAHRYYQDEESRAIVSILLLTLGLWASFFWYGIVAYQWALLLLLGFLALDRPRLHSGWVLMFSLGIFFSHAMVLLVFCGLVVVGVFTGHARRSHLLALLPVFLLSVWFMAGRHLGHFQAPEGDAVWASLWEAMAHKLGGLLVYGPFKTFALPDGATPLEQAPWLYALGAVTNLVVVGGLGALTLRATYRRLIQHGDPPDPQQHSYWLAAGLLVLGYVLAPYHFFGLIHPGGRLVLPLLMLMLALWPSVKITPLRTLAGAAVLGTSLTLVGYGLALHPEPGAIHKTPEPDATLPQSASSSIFAFNDWQMRNSRYRYFIYRIYQFPRRFDQLADNRLAGSSFVTGPILAFPSSP